MPSLRNKVVVLTGASSGFGRGAAIEFAKRGAKLVLAARRKNLLKDVAAECKRRGTKAIVVETDVSSQAEVEALAEAALSKFDRIDVWVNNAGVATIGRFDEIPMDEHEQVVETDLLGTMYGSHFALKQFREQGSGTLINIGSYLSKGSSPYHASYVASKHGVRGLGMALRQELEANGEDDRIHVCTIMPTSMDTPFFEHAGQHTGHRVQPIDPVYDPKLVIDAIIRVAMNPEDEVMVGRSAKFASVLGKIMPGVLERKMASKTHKDVFSKSPRQAPGERSVMEPMDEGEGVRGGWLDAEGNRQEPEQKSSSHVGTVATVIGSIAIVGFALAKRKEIQQKLAA